MGILHVTQQGGRRLMPPAERDALKENPKHNVDRASAVEEERYQPGQHAEDAGLVEPAGHVLILYTRYWSHLRYRFVVEARDRYMDIRAQTKHRVYGDRAVRDDTAKGILEETLRQDGIIT